MGIEPQSRTAEHYRRLLATNPNASIGYALAANCVYAARFGACDALHRETWDWETIARDLKLRYGSHLEAVTVLLEMEPAPGLEERAV